MGTKETSEFWLHGKLVGRAHWNPDGSPALAVGIREGALYGYQIEYHDDGGMYAEPFVQGVLHGWAKQWNGRGRLLLMSPFKRGTGTDYWCNAQGRLAEEHPLVEGKPSGTERWWDDDQERVYSETEWLDGNWHGVTRHWTHEKLDRGYPKFFIRGKQVSRREYLAAMARDPSLPPFREEENLPLRALPTRFIELRRRVRQKGRLGSRARAQPMQA